MAAREAGRGGPSARKSRGEGCAESPTGGSERAGATGRAQDGQAEDGAERAGLRGPGRPVRGEWLPQGSRERGAPGPVTPVDSEGPGGRGLQGSVEMGSRASFLLPCGVPASPTRAPLRCGLRGAPAPPTGAGLCTGRSASLYFFVLRPFSLPGPAGRGRRWSDTRGAAGLGGRRVRPAALAGSSGPCCEPWPETTSRRGRPATRHVPPARRPRARALHGCSSASGGAQTRTRRPGAGDPRRGAFPTKGASGRCSFPFPDDTAPCPFTLCAGFPGPQFPRL